ncbi:tuftelin isoform X2 [Oxyura jamaicensis]|uniref:tuftelin isoform X2 n=1 Tax=Oxyura jamaicensis TaxID=8884 RepID=UPI0015A6C3CD|nr:tuftelin isoform X2 [Oxyura jamaicensis]
MTGRQGWCAVLDVRPHGQSPESVKVLRLTLPNDLPGDRQVKQKPVGKAFAMVANRSSNGHSLASECIKSNDGDEEIIKVYLKARAEGGVNHEEHVSQLKSEVRYIQEARSSLKKLREDLSSKLENRQGDKQHAQVVLEKQNGSWLHPESPHADSWEDQEEDYSGDDVEKIRQTAKRLFTKLQEAERRHQLEKKDLERVVSQYQEEAEQTSSALRRAEKSVLEKEVQVDELQRLLAGMEKEHRSLLLKMKEGEAELARLRSAEGDRLAEQDRSAKLEKEVAMLREKIHHLDDMLKSQQRKVRQMIEQLQNSKTVIQAKDAVIQELKEKVAYLEAEVCPSGAVLFALENVPCAAPRAVLVLEAGVGALSEAVASGAAVSSKGVQNNLSKHVSPAAKPFLPTELQLTACVSEIKIAFLPLGL